MNQIHDHGENDPIPFELSDTDRAIADVCKHAIAEQRYYLNTRDRLQQRRRGERTRGRGMKRGQTIGWVVVDPETGEPVIWCKSRSEARRVAEEAGARYCRAVVA